MKTVNNLIPMVVEQTANGERAFDILPSFSGGMIAESYISYKMGLLEENEYKKIDTFISSIPKFKIDDFNINKLLDYIKMDKKQSINNNRFILLNGIGSAIIKEDIDVEIIKKALNKI